MANICDRCMHRIVCEFRDPFEECEACSQFMEEVVRCKDCKYCRESEIAEMRGIKFCYRLMHPTEDRHIGYNFADDDFCSYEERKDENS